MSSGRKELNSRRQDLSLRRQGFVSIVSSCSMRHAIGLRQAWDEVQGHSQAWLAVCRLGHGNGMGHSMRRSMKAQHGTARVSTGVQHWGTSWDGSGVQHWGMAWGVHGGPALGYGMG